MAKLAKMDDSVDSSATAEEHSQDEMPGAQIPAYVLNILCSMVSFTQVKQFRLICRDWNITVSTHPRIRNCTAVFRADWVDKARGLHFASCLPWKSVYFHFFPFNRNVVFPAYWAVTGQNVTRLQCKYVKISCDRMAALLMSMPHLTDVTFNQCNFATTKKITGGGDPKTMTAREKRRFTLKCACHHERFEIKPGMVMPPPRIRRLAFTKEDYFPMCLFDILIARTNGVLEEFAYNHARLARWRRINYRPIPQHVEDKVYDIVRRNAETIRDFSYFRNFRGELFLIRLLANNINLPLRVCSLGQQASWTHMGTAPDFIQYINSLSNSSLEELTVRFIHRFSGVDFAAAIAAKTALRYLFIDTVWCDRGQHVGLPSHLNLENVLPQLTRLETLVLRDRNRRSFPSMNSNYLDNLPHSLKSLTFFGFYLSDGKINRFIRTPAAMRLHTLCIEGGRFLTDATMQLIINTLPQLEVLGVNDSRYLTDAGVTGIPLEACKKIIDCNQRSILTGDVTRDFTGVSINRLTNLRRLSFHGCRKLSDITLLIGIKFPLLREVDMSRCLNVTDMGLISLAQNNPCLERIVVMHNLKITRYGLNQVLMANDTIANIHTSKKVRNRNMGGQLSYETTYRFLTAVTYCRWDERRARPMYTD